MEGYKRIVVEVPVRVKQKIDEMAKGQDMSLKDCLVDMVDFCYEIFLEEKTEN